VAFGWPLWGLAPAKVACNPATALLFCESELWDEADKDGRRQLYA
jgi:hypothetical protein